MYEIISVIIPVYNTERYLRRCVDSVLSQTYSQLEIILVNDDSTDSSAEICNQYAEKDSRIKAIHKSNGGASSARNEGLRNATGNYVVFLDSDDFWNNDSAISNIVQVIENRSARNVDLLCFGYQEFVEDKGYNGVGIDFSLFDRNQSNEKCILLREVLSKGIYVSSPWCKVVSLDLIRKHQLYFCEGVTAEDIDWSARLLKVADNIAVYCDSFYSYRQRSESIVHNLKYENLKTVSDSIIKCVELGKDIESKEFFDLYYNYVSYQYITFLKVALLCESDLRTKPLLKKMKAYTWLLDYHLNKKVRIVYWFNKLLGFKLMHKCLKIYSR